MKFVFITICNAESDECFVMDFVIFVLSRFGTKLLATDHLIIWERTKFLPNWYFRNLCLKLWH